MRRDGPRPPSFFAKYFEGSVVPMPSFSKECLGGFVEFQWLAMAPNRQTDFALPHFFCEPKAFARSKSAVGMIVPTLPED
jgi:hypothetical protein